MQYMPQISARPKMIDSSVTFYLLVLGIIQIRARVHVVDRILHRINLEFNRHKRSGGFGSDNTVLVV